MIDLFIAMGVIAALAIVVLVATAVLLTGSSEAQPRHASLSLTLFIVLSRWLLFGTKDRLFWARVIPVSAAIVYPNVTVLSLAAGAGAALRLPNRP